MAALTIAVVGVPGTDAGADETTVRMPAGAFVIGGCVLTSTGTLAFGSYNPLGANAGSPLDVSPNALTIACSRGLSAAVYLDDGKAFSAGFRRMTDGRGDYLSYQIYTDATRTTVWNLNTPVWYVATSKAPTPLPVYGRVPGGQDAPASSAYADTVTARVLF